jgi:dipeptidase E
MQIVAIGGGGFSTEPENPLIDDYILSLARRRSPRVCFVPTASGDSESYILRFFDAFSEKDCAPSYLSLFKRKAGSMRDFVMRQDVIYVGGGNTVNLLAVWRAHGLDQILKAALSDGIVLCGISAGSLCWFQDGVTDSFGPKLARLNDGLCFLAGSNCPHYDGESERRPAYHRLIAEGLPAGVAADDGCALHFEAGQLKRIVSSRKDAKAYRVELVEGQVREEALNSEFLG